MGPAASCMARDRLSIQQALPARFILDAERQWQDANCDHNKITEKILADDFWALLRMEHGMGKRRK